MKKKIIITIVCAATLYVAFVLGQVFTLKTQQLGFKDGHFESTVFVGTDYHRYDYTSQSFKY